MNQNYINTMNIAGEGVMCAVLFLLLVSCFFQKKKQETVKALKALIITDILLLICQMAEWYMLMDRRYSGINFVQDFSGFIKIAYAADFFLYYMTLVLFHNYAKIQINGIMEIKKPSMKKQNTGTRLFVFIGIILTAAFIIILNNDRFYFWDSYGNEIYDISAYWVLNAIANYITILAAAGIIRNRKLLGRFNSSLLLAYIVVPPGIVVLDIKYKTCLSYLLQAIFILTIYILLDLRIERELNEKKELILRQEKELTELNTKIMLSQIGPHFLNNILCTISALCYMDGAYKAKNMVDKFSVYMRENLDSLGSKRFISFNRELSHIENYLWLEQVRFGDVLSVEYDIGISDFMIPSLSVQPLVENAVNHGIRKKKGGGTVKISTRELKNEYLVIVSDDGAGFDVGDISDDISNVISNDERSHTGIENVRSRIQILCGGSCEVVSKKGEGTTVTLYIPKETGG